MPLATRHEAGCRALAAAAGAWAGHRQARARVDRVARDRGATSRCRHRASASWNSTTPRSGGSSTRSAPGRRAARRRLAAAQARRPHARDDRRHGIPTSRRDGGRRGGPGAVGVSAKLVCYGDGGASVVTTAEAEGSRWNVVEYDVADVLKAAAAEEEEWGELLTIVDFPNPAATQAPPGRRGEGDVLVDLVKNSVAPDSWRDAGGSVGWIRYGGGRLVVGQTLENQRRVRQILEDLRRPKPGTPVAPPRRCRPRTRRNWWTRRCPRALAPGTFADDVERLAARRRERVLRSGGGVGVDQRGPPGYAARGGPVGGPDARARARRAFAAASEGRPPIGSRVRDRVLVISERERTSPPANVVRFYRVTPGSPVREAELLRRVRELVGQSGDAASARSESAPLDAQVPSPRVEYWPGWLVVRAPVAGQRGGTVVADASGGGGTMTAVRRNTRFALVTALLAVGGYAAAYLLTPRVLPPLAVPAAPPDRTAAQAPRARCPTSGSRTRRSARPSNRSAPPAARTSGWTGRAGPRRDAQHPDRRRGPPARRAAVDGARLPGRVRAAPRNSVGLLGRRQHHRHRPRVRLPRRDADAGLRRPRAARQPRRVVPRRRRASRSTRPTRVPRRTASWRSSRERSPRTLARRGRQLRRAPVRQPPPRRHAGRGGFATDRAAPGGAEGCRARAPATGTGASCASHAAERSARGFRPRLSKTRGPHAGNAFANARATRSLPGRAATAPSRARTASSRR